MGSSCMDLPHHTAPNQHGKRGGCQEVITYCFADKLTPPTCTPSIFHRLGSCPGIWCLRACPTSAVSGRDIDSAIEDNLLEGGGDLGLRIPLRDLRSGIRTTWLQKAVSRCALQGVLICRHVIEHHGFGSMMRRSTSWPGLQVFVGRSPMMKSE